MNIKDEIRKLRMQMKEMSQEAKKKEEAYEQSMADYEKMPKDVNRYTVTACLFILRMSIYSL